MHSSAMCEENKSFEVRIVKEKVGEVVVMCQISKWEPMFVTLG
jgi:hypothetical protein